MAKIDELNVEYTELCTKLGSVVYHIDTLEKEKESILLQINEIEKQAKLLKENQ